MGLLKKLFRRTPERTQPYCAALIAAAGSSTRYGGENKLLQELGGMPVLARTLLAVDRAARIDEIVIAAGALLCALPLLEELLALVEGFL